MPNEYFSNLDRKFKQLRFLKECPLEPNGQQTQQGNPARRLVQHHNNKSAYNNLLLT